MVSDICLQTKFLEPLGISASLDTGGAIRRGWESYWEWLGGERLGGERSKLLIGAEKGREDQGGGI